MLVSKEGATFEQFLLRLVEPEMLDREAACDKGFTLISLVAEEAAIRCDRCLGG